jgi:peptidoglycan-associated lipoprotein
LKREKRSEQSSRNKPVLPLRDAPAKDLKMSRLTMIVLWPAALMLAACAAPLPPAPPPPAVTVAPNPPSTPAAPVEAVKTVAVTESPMEAFERLQSRLDRNSVYFDYDKYAIKPSADSVIAQHSQALQTYPHDSLTLQGNCDERGSSEYNLALGQRRADAVKEKLVLLGVSGDRIETISFGKEKPRETCHEEKCWAANRRADFVDAWK